MSWTLKRLFGRSDVKEARPWSHIRTMLRPEELDHLQQLAQHVRGVGALVDLGAYVGGSTAALAAGAWENEAFRSSGQKVHGFDRYTLTPWHIEHYPDPGFKDGRPGDSFMHVAEKNLAPWAPIVEFHQADLGLTYDWRTPIEVLHVDAMKTWDLANGIMRSFFPHLVAGESWILHQDHVHYRTYWIHLLMHRFRDHVEPVGQVGDTTTVAFRCTRPFRKEQFLEDLGDGSFTADDRAAAFDRSAELIKDPFMRLRIQAARALSHANAGEADEARRVFGQALEQEKELIGRLGKPGFQTELVAASTALEEAINR